MQSVIHTINKLRSAEERVKLRWIYALTGLCTVIILGVFLLYSRISSPTSLSFGDQPSASPSIVTTLKTGALTIINSLRSRTANTILYFKQKFGATNTIYIDVSKKSAPPYEEETEPAGNEKASSENVESIKQLFN